ncbi:DUF5681 domain-containing protein [Bradyrhizobium sp. AUGA SZCCT0283]|uniref:DUF5681 domain-containing protein n=1 Tax=Bradyrhizobium sp. AUGA SZCCT0283 TaxID=2807671 RepID=UPI001BABE25E|nr:DUF5681 domain-containing protein [Bradyrhizobium sp. AUGA SZCCT0283]MBR1276090.1 hypothetical protein [Bradyrhizobium sp. AUGA SZCCT0283]
MNKDNPKNGNARKRKIKRLRLPSRDDDSVGYGRPPRAHQFKPGQSGNPKGRPKGRKNEATMLDELLFQRIPVRQGGRELRMTVIEAIFRRLAEDSLKGNIKAAGFLFNRLSAISSDQPQQSELMGDDQAVLKAYLNDYLSKTEKDGKRGKN